MSVESRFIELTTRDSVSDLLRQGCTVHFEGLDVCLLTNDSRLVDALLDYFGPLAKKDVSGQGSADSRIEVWAYEASEPKLDLKYQDWPRGPGKSGRKEEFASLGEGRVVRKVRTGMHFFIDQRRRIAFGPCRAQANQVINFINAQVIAHFMAQGFQLCHAAAVYLGNKGVMIAAASGGGKSTLAMHLMTDGARFTSNDRLLVERRGDENIMLGVPKWPRINPGTALNNPALAEILSAPRSRELSRLPKDELWELEEKYDVPIAETYGPERIKFGGPLSLLVLLNWSHQSDAPTTFRELKLEQHPELLDLLMKNAGPLVYSSDQREAPEAAELSFEPAEYLNALAGVPVLLCEGRPDFSAAVGELKRRVARGS